MFREHVSPARALSENWQREITPKILMPELWILCMTLDPLKLLSTYEVSLNSISWTRVICKIKSVTGKVWRMDRQTDRQTDKQTDRQTDGQTTEKWSLSVTFAYSRWHKKIISKTRLTILYDMNSRVFKAAMASAPGPVFTQNPKLSKIFNSVSIWDLRLRVRIH